MKNDDAISKEYVTKFIANKNSDRYIVSTYNAIKQQEEVNTEEDEKQIRLEQHEFDF